MGVTVLAPVGRRALHRLGRAGARIRIDHPAVRRADRGRSANAAPGAPTPAFVHRFSIGFFPRGVPVATASAPAKPQFLRDSIAGRAFEARSLRPKPPAASRRRASVARRDHSPRDELL